MLRRFGERSLNTRALQERPTCRSVDRGGSARVKVGTVNEAVDCARSRRPFSRGARPQAARSARRPAEHTQGLPQSPAARANVTTTTTTIEGEAFPGGRRPPDCVAPAPRMIARPLPALPFGPLPRAQQPSARFVSLTLPSCSSCTTQAHALDVCLNPPLNGYGKDYDCDSNLPAQRTVMRLDSKTYVAFAIPAQRAWKAPSCP